MMHTAIIRRLIKVSSDSGSPTLLVCHASQQQKYSRCQVTTASIAVIAPMRRTLHVTTRQANSVSNRNKTSSHLVKANHNSQHLEEHRLLTQAPTHGYHSRPSTNAIMRRDTGVIATASRLLQATDPIYLKAMASARRSFFSQSEQREMDDIVSFYDDKVTQYANQDIQTVTLKALLGLGRSGLTTSSSPPLSTSTPTATAASAQQRRDEEAAKDLAINLDVARYARKELPVRLARLIKETQKLPFIVGTNPYIKRVYKLYYDSFQTITASPQQIKNKEDLDRFANLLQGLVASHADVIPMLSQGFLECKKYMEKEAIKKYLDGIIQARIGIRLIAEQVISLREQRDYNEEKTNSDIQNASGERMSTSSQSLLEAVPRRHSDVVGVVHTELRPADLIKTCASFVQDLCDVNYGSSPEVVINGQTDATFTYVPVHLEYILCELLKNAVRATVEHSQKIGRSAISPHGTQHQPLFSSSAAGSHHEKRSNSAVIINQDDDQDITRRPNEFGHPPVEVTIAQGEHEITIRIRDHGGGIPREYFDSIFDYSFTTVKNENDTANSMDAGGDTPYGVDSIFKGVSRLAMQAGLGGPIAGLGFGLPLTKIYAQYFGGDMQLVSLQGYGCDVFLKLKQIDENLDELRI